jgi:uncharacterized DUF497 family protein
VVEITWDDRKKADNPKKHDGVTFEEGQTIFFDPLVQYFEDSHSDQGQLILVSFVDYPGRHHMLSARKPTSKERKAYEEGI